MNTRNLIPKTIPAALCAGALVALAMNAANAAETATIVSITAPNTPFAVTALNTNGQVTGYFFDSESAQRAFIWGGGNPVDLGTLGGSLSVGFSMNNQGRIVGYSSTTDDAEFHAFVNNGNALLNLGTLGGTFSSANDINDAGTVVGQSYVAINSPVYRAFALVNGGAMQDLGTLGGSSSSATAVNNTGQVIGDSSVAADLGVHAFLHSGGVMRDLGTLGGSSSMAVALNELGQVTGEAATAGEDTHAFLFDGNTTRDLGTLGGSRSSGRHINNSGEVAGDSTTLGDAANRGFIYRNNVMQDLGTLGGASSTARDLNNLGQVVGSSFDANQQERAFLWENGTMTDLNALLPANSGWNLTRAAFINDHRQIVGEGFYMGAAGWYLLTLGGDENHPPVANAGSDQAFSCGAAETRVTLDGSASSDPDHEELTYQWSETGALLGNGAILNVLLPPGSHTIVLRVTDTLGEAAEDSVMVVVGADTTPPVVECPRGRTLPAGERGRALVPNFLESLVASDNCTAASALVKQQSPAAGTVVRCGTHTVTLSVVDSTGNRTTCSTTLLVADVTSPVVRCPEEIIRRARTNCQAAVPDLTERVNASDNCTPRAELLVSQRPAPGTLVGVGVHDITVTVTDAAGNTSTCSTVFQVADLTRPTFSALSASPNVLSPANGQMVSVNLTAEVRDNCDPSPRCRIVWVSSNERSPGGAEGLSSDWRITGDMNLELRAAVTSPRCARVYTILVACTDASGNLTFRTTHVKVTRK